LGNQVIIAGRRKSVLSATVDANPGMKSVLLDIGNAEDIRRMADVMVTEFPTLNVLVHNAGVMRTEMVLDRGVADAEEMLTTNLLGPIRLTAALLPQLRSQPNATIIGVSSGLAFVPRATNPTYCATKAALHSYLQSLRYQLRDLGISVVEIVPPYVRTELNGPDQAADANAMPLDAYIAETMGILRDQPDAIEICVSRVRPIRNAETSGQYDALYTKLNATTPGAANAPN
jgi:uncharacterized oxidoreductase